MLRKFVTDITPSAPDPGPAPIFGRVIRLHDLYLAACRWWLPLGDVLIHNGRRLVFPKDRRLQLLLFLVQLGFLLGGLLNAWATRSGADVVAVCLFLICACVVMLPLFLSFGAVILIVIAPAVMSVG